MSVSRAIARVVGVLVVASSSACASGGVAIPPGGDALPPCKPQRIDVADLESIGAPGCDLVGSQLGLPSGDHVEVPAVGVTSGQQDDPPDGPEVVVGNWGVPGLSVAVVADGRLSDVWTSSPEARDLMDAALAGDGVDG